MAAQFTVFIDEDVWRVGCAEEADVRVEPVAFDDKADTSARVQAALAHLEAMGYAGQRIALALPSTWCLCAVISTAGLERGGRRRAMGYRLEEHLPISAEQFVADYLDLGNEQVLGVCSERQRLEELVAAFDAAGVMIAEICPVVLLAADHVARRRSDADALLLATAGGDEPTDLVELSRCQPVHWWWLAGDPSALHQRLDELSETLDEGLMLRLGGTSPEDVAALTPAGWQSEALEDENVDTAAAEAAARILEGSQTGWINLRSGALAAPEAIEVYRKPALMLLAAAVLLLISICVVMQWRGQQYDALARHHMQEQVKVFGDTFEGQRPPAGGVKRRLQIERQLLAGRSGQASADANVDEIHPPSALQRLGAVLASLPEGIRFRILYLDIYPDRVRIEGQAVSHVEAERIANALRATGRFEADPPRTQAMRERGVTFSFTARPRQEPTARTRGLR